MARDTLENSAPLKIVTVHGTGAGDPESTSGERWWQHGSDFQKELAQRVDIDGDDVEVVPFQWERGPNHETARRKAGRDLLKRLREYDESGDAYILMGHSHGGSVIYHALLQSAHEEAPLQRLQQWTTIGTPFLNYKKNRFLYQRLTGLNLSFYTTGIAAFLIAVTYWLFGSSTNFDHVAYANTQDLPPALMRLAHQIDMPLALKNTVLALVAYAVICFLLLLLIEQRRKRWFSNEEKKQVETWYGDRWLGLWHREDEAISALFNVRNVSYNVIPRSFLAPVVSYANIVLVAYVGLAVALNIIFSDGYYLAEFAYELSSPFFEDDIDTGLQVANSGELHWGFQAAAFAMILGPTVLAIGAATWLLKYVARVLGIPFAAAFNKIIWKSIRDRAWGDDLPSEDVRGVAAHPPEFSKQFPHLPDAVSVPLKTHSDGHAITTLNKVRLLLGMADGDALSTNMRSELSETLNWQELIHTSYFDVPEFVDLIAMQLEKTGLVRSRDGYHSDRHTRQELDAWLDGQAQVPV